MVSIDFTSGVITNTKVFSWVFLVDFIMTIIVTLFMLYFFNRAAAWLLSHLVEWYLWKKHKIRVKVQSIQISILGARVFFKNMSYIGSNEVLSAVHGSLTWRYWIRRPRMTEYLENSAAGTCDDDSEDTHWKSNSEAPTRLNLRLSGLEWFVFNRSPAYDALLDGFEKAQMRDKANGSSNNMDIPEMDEKSEPEKLNLPSDHENADVVDNASTSPPPSNEFQFDYSQEMLLRLLPIEVECSKGALVMGNRSTTSLLVFHISSGTALIDAAKATSPLDKHRMKYTLKLNKPIMEIRPNIDQIDSEAAKELFEQLKFTDPKVRNFFVGVCSDIVSAVVNLPLWILKRLYSLVRKKVADNDAANTDPYLYDPNLHGHWRGLSRYQVYRSSAPNSEEDINSEIINDDVEVEYAKFSTVLDAAHTEITFFYDIPGQVPDDFTARSVTCLNGPNVGNGGEPPEYGVDIMLDHCTLHYGPWAHRERLSIQQFLFPRACYDSEPEPMRKKGDDRIYTEFKFHIEFKGETIFRTPTREVSKNAAFLQKLKDNPFVENTIRAFGWFEIMSPELTTFSYTQALVPGIDGWCSNFNLHLENPELRSSVNHSLLLSSDTYDIDCQIHVPHQWNGLQTWSLTNTLKNTQIFLLREHVTLLTDVFTDFASGPQEHYDMFSPTKYVISFAFHEYKLYLNVNDQNVINNPCDFEDNIYISLQGDLLNIDLVVPLDEISPVKKHFDISLHTSFFDLVIDAPSWHTVNSFSNVSGKGVGRAYNFNLKGGYTFFSYPSPTNVDTLLLDCSADTTTLICYGFILNYLMKIRENYFGEFVQFQTLEEFSNSTRQRTVEFTRHRTECATDVLLYVYINGGTIVLPTQLYTAENGYCRLDFASLDTDCRFTNYYMDLQMNISPLKGKFSADHVPNSEILDFAYNGDSTRPEIEEPNQIFIDGMVIHGNRLFGLPPTEPTYFCKWDFDIGVILVNGPVSIVELYERVIENVGFTFNDFENALAEEEPPLYDVTVLSLNIVSIRAQLYEDEESCLVLETGHVALSFNDLANSRYSAKIRATVPSIKLSVLGGIDKKNPNSYEKGQLLASFNTSLACTNFMRKRDFKNSSRLQQEHLMLHDAEFKRCPFLLDEEHRYNPKYTDVKQYNHFPLPLETVAPPLNGDTLHVLDHSAAFTRDNDTSSSGTSEWSNTVGTRGPELQGERGRQMHRKGEALLNDDRPKNVLPESVSSNASRASSSSRIQRGSKSDSSLDEPNNAFLPPKSWRWFAPDLHESQDDIDAFNLEPSSHYNEADIHGTHTATDESAKYNNLILQLGKIEGIVTPLVFKSAHQLLDAFDRNNIDFILDKLQIEFLNKFKLRLLPYLYPEVDTIRLVVPLISLRYSDIYVDNMDIEKSHIYAESKNINFVVKTSRTKKLSLDQVMNNLDISPEKTIFFETDSLIVGVKKVVSGKIATDIVSPLFFHAENCVFWWNETEESCASLKLRSLDFFIAHDHIAWLADFLAYNVQEIQKLTDSSNNKIKRGHHDNHLKLIYLIHELSKASESHNIADDPSVLTRPTYIIQSSDHIRTTTSWKILVRLRHILQSLPQSWRDRESELISSGNCKLPSNVRARVTDTFSRWRSWELSNVPHSFIFRYIFAEKSLKEYIISLTTRINVGIESIGFRTHYPDGEDFVCFDYFQFMSGWMRQSSLLSGPKLGHLSRLSTSTTGGSATESSNNDASYLNIDGNISCSNIRSRITLKALEAAGILYQFSKNLTKDNESPLPSSSSKISQKSHFSFSGSVTIDSATSEFVIPSLECIIESRRWSVAVVYSDTPKSLSNVIIHSEKFAIGLFERIKDQSQSVFNFDMSRVTIAGNSNDLSLVSDKMIDFQSMRSILRSSYSVENLIRLAIKIQSLDMPLIARSTEAFIDHVAKSDKLSTGSATDSRNSLLPMLGALNVSIVMSECEFFVPIALSVGLLLDSDRLKVDVKIDRQKVMYYMVVLSNVEAGLTESEYKRHFAKATLSDLDIIGSFYTEPRLLNIPQVLDVCFRLGNAQFETASLVKVINQISALHKYNAFERIQNSANELVRTVAVTEEKKLSDSSLKKKVKLLYRTRAFVKQVLVRIPIDELAMTNLTTDTTLEFGNFSPADEDLPYELPLFMDVDVGDFRILIDGPQVPENVSSIFRLQSKINLVSVDSRKKFDILVNDIRILLCLETAKALATYIKKVGIVLNNLKSLELSAAGSDSKDTQKLKYLDTGTHSDGQSLTSDLDIKLSLRNSNVIWILGSEVPRKSCHGYVIGCQLVEMLKSSTDLALTFKGVYGTPAMMRDVLTRRIFDCQSASNTIFLPVVNIKGRYLVEKSLSPVWKLEISGEAIQIKVLPSSVNILGDVYLSLSTFSSEVGESLKVLVSQHELPSHTSTKVRSLRLPISLEIEFSFEAAQIDIWDEEMFKQQYEKPGSPHSLEDDAPYTIAGLPALSATTPGIKGILLYTRSPDLVMISDDLTIQIVVTSTTNTIYPKVVPVARDMLSRIKEMVVRNTEMLAKTKGLIESSKEDETKYVLTAEDVDHVTANLDIRAHISWMRQELTFSCMPKAKIEASVSFDEFSIGMDTTNVDLDHISAISDRLTTLSMKFSGFRASLQHVYSREVSGYISIREILLMGSRIKQTALESQVNPLNIGGKVEDVMLDINMKRLQEVELFQDLWLPDGIWSWSAPPMNQETLSNEAGNLEGLVAKYHRASTTTALPWSIDLAVINVKGNVDLGKTIGEIELCLDRFWISASKLSNWEQSLAFGFDELSFTSQGRLGALFCSRGFHTHIGIMWNIYDDKSNSIQLDIPLIHATTMLDSVESKASLDYHTFFIGQVNNLKFGMSNNRGDLSMEFKDQLFVVGDCSRISVFLTDLAASYVLDVIWTFKRLRTDSNANYHAILQDAVDDETLVHAYKTGSSKELQDTSKSVCKMAADPGLVTGMKKQNLDDVLAGIITKLEVSMNLKLDELDFFVFPNSFVEVVAFCISLDTMEATFDQRNTPLDDEENGGAVESHLKMNMNSFDARLSSMKKRYPKDVGQVTPGEFVDFTLDNAKGGTIIGVPSVRVDMTTWQRDGSNIVEYVFKSTLDGRVEVGWNLGSIDFIRDMWSNHARAYASRMEAYSIAKAPSVLESANLDDKLKEVELSSRFIYSAREPPEIATPQLREMGDATPPIEWMGLHRQKFPGLTHETVIVGLQQLLHRFEVVYERVLGHS